MTRAWPPAGPRRCVVLPLVSAAVVVVLAGVVAAGPVPAVDQWVFDLGLGDRSRLATLVAEAVTWLGSMYVLVPLSLAMVVAVVAWPRRSDGGALPWRLATWPLGAALAASTLTTVAKVVVGRDRPPGTHGLLEVVADSYPSGHSSQATAWWGALALAWNAESGAGRVARSAFGLVPAVMVAVVVGLSRLCLGVHWLTDVVGGWALGVGILSAMVAWKGAARPARESAPPG